MKIARVLYHGLAVTLIDLGCILIGYAVWWVLRQMGAVTSQLLVQAASAGFLILTAVAFWIELFPIARWKPMHLRSGLEYWLVLPASLLWFPVLFYPLHFMTQGYMSKFENVLAVWAFQLPVNALALWAAYSNARQGGFFAAEPDAAQGQSTVSG